MAALGFALAVVGPAMAQDDPPGRVGRLVDVQGSVAWWDAENGQWADAVRNRPLTALDRISTSAGSGAEIRVGSVVARLGPSTELEVRRLDDDAISLQLHSGSLALRIRSAEVAAEVDVVTREARALPLRSGHYRFDRLDDTTSVGVWRGELQIEEVSGGPVTAGQRLELTREARRGAVGSLEVTGTGMPDDAFGRWVLGEDAREQRTASSRFVSPEMTGAEDLDRFGRWTEHPEFGAIWFPTDVRDDWAPYREGRWSWVAPWGWTWIDDSRWGFAPFHYGRWVFWRGGWGWVPGAVVARPVYAPGLVAWVGVPDGGGLGMGWLPLAPREVYRPHYRVSPRYLERVNVAPRYRWDPEPAHPRRGGPVYGNQAVPGAVTLMPTDTPMGRPQRDRHEGPGPRQFAPGAPPPPPPRREAGPEAQPRQPAPPAPQVPHPQRYLSPPAPAVRASPVPAVGPAPAPVPAPAGRPGPAPAAPPFAPPPRIREPAVQPAPVMPPVVQVPAADPPPPARQTVNPRAGSRQPTPPPPPAPSPSLPPSPPPPSTPSHSPAPSPSPAPAPAAVPPTAPAHSDAPATPAPKGAPPERAPRGEGERNEERKPRAEPRPPPKQNLPKENLH